VTPVDDGLASVFAALVSVEALVKATASRIIVVAIGHWNPVQMLAHRVEAVYCANIG
jgi:predicted phosphoribosyltransferase